MRKLLSTKTVAAAAPRAVQSDIVRVNGADIYFEIRGSGPSLLLIHGTMLDSRCFGTVADRLSDRYTVITYDRRGYSRSARPIGWVATSIQEQADDAMGLLKALGAAPSDVFGSSSGGLVALELVLRHPDMVRRAILHEPALFAHLPEAFVGEQFAELTALAGEAIAGGGPRAALPVVLGALSEGDLGLVDDALLERWGDNAELALEMEFPSMVFGYRPSEESIANRTKPVLVARAAISLPVNIAAAEWLARTLGVAMQETSGSHLAYCERPHEFAEEVHRLLELSSRGGKP